MALTFQATMAEEESHTRSRSMETSLRMRLDHGVPLTPKLFGYTHDEDGHLQINPDEAPTVKLIFYMYLYGYSTQQIADTLTNQARSTYFGKSCWSSSGIVSILRNERHCGDVLTRKTVTENYRTHRTLKNRGEKPQSRYYNHHDAIIRRDDFNAVQRMLDNAKYGNKSILPELRVIHDGLLKGFVSINPRWSGFKEGDYLSASRSAYTDIPTAGAPSQIPADATFAVNAGDFDLRGFEITRTEFLGTHSQPFVTFADKKVKFSAACVRHFGAKRYVELLINPLEMKFAVRPTDSSNRSGVIISSNYNGKPQPREISAAAFSDTIFHLFGWNTACKYRINGILCEDAGQLVYIFDVADSETFIRSQELSVRAASTNEETIHPLSTLGKHVRAIPEQWVGTFGKEFYLHECSLSALEHIIRDLLESYGLSLGTRKAPCVICAVSTLEQIYQTHGYHMLSRVLRLCAGTWEGDENSFSANILNGITRLVYTFGDQLNDEVFKERVGALSIKQLVRMSKERCPGSMGYVEAMLLEYNGKKKNISQRLSMNKLHMQGTAGLCSLLSDVDTSPEAATAEGVSE